MDFPDHTSNGIWGHCSLCKFQGNITPLITVEEMDEMVKVNLGDYVPGE